MKDHGINYPEDQVLRNLLAEELRKIQESTPERKATAEAAKYWPEYAAQIVKRLQDKIEKEESKMIIPNGKWSKQHVMEGIVKVCDTPELVANARNLDAFEWGVYRGECTQLIDNMFYGFQFPIRKIWGIDSFEGLPEEAAGIDRFYLFQKGMFADVGPKLYPLRPNGNYIKAWFNQITPKEVKELGMNKAAFVHIDGDLYISCIDALTVMLENDLIIPGTVISYDEFKSTEDLNKGGESLATFELCDKYKVEMTEFFRNIYQDKGVELWQNCFVVNSIGEKNECKLL